MTLVSGNIRLCGYSRVFPYIQERQTIVRLPKTAIFSTFASSSEALEVRPTLLYYLDPHRLSTDPKIRDLERP